MCDACKEYLERRGFIKKTLSAAALLTAPSLLFSNPLYEGVHEKPKEESIENLIIAEDVSFKNGHNTIKGFLSRPKNAIRLKPIIISHGFGEIDYLKYTATRFALAGYAAFVFLEEIKPENSIKTKDVWDASVEYLYAKDFIIKKGVGLVGFCAGGRNFMVLAAKKPYVKAVVSIYGKVTNEGHTSPMDLVEKIKVPLQAHFGVMDKVVPLENAKKFDALIKQNNSKAETYYYQQCGHSYCNFGIPQGTMEGFDYNYEAAMKTYERSIKFIKKHF
jgi:dienelactone hydrolase